MKKIFSFLILLLPFMLFAAPADGPKQKKVANDTVVPQTFQYVVRNGKPLLLDLYRPANPRPDSACVVYIFGGGFAVGARNEECVRSYCQLLAKHGFTAIAIDYRLHLKEVDYDSVNLFNMQAVFRDAINFAAADASDAVAFICRHSAEWGIAQNRIIMSGCSAGAITALQLDYCRCNSLPPTYSLPSGWQPAAIVAFAGGIFSEEGRPSYSKKPAPTFFLHGDIDKIVNYKKFPPILREGLYGAKKLHRVFEKENYPHWFFRFEGIGHEVAMYHIVMYDEFEAFVNKTLKGRSMHYDAEIHDDNLRPTKWSKMNVFDLYKGGN